MPDVIVAMFSEISQAERVRTALVDAGFAADRVAVSSASEPGPAMAVPVKAGEDPFHVFFRTLLANSVIAEQADELAAHVQHGAAALIVHPRGRVELHDADQILEQNNPRLVRRDVRQSLAPTPVVGEHAAGKH